MERSERYTEEAKEDQREDSYVATAIKGERQRQGIRQYRVEWNHGDFDTWEDSDWVEDEEDLGPLLYHFKESQIKEQNQVVSAKKKAAAQQKPSTEKPASITTDPDLWKPSYYSASASSSAFSLPSDLFSFGYGPAEPSTILKITVNYMAEQLLADLALKENLSLLNDLGDEHRTDIAKLKVKIASGGNCSFAFVCTYEDRRRHFLKVNFNEFATAMFTTEARGLAYISETVSSVSPQQHTLFCVPAVIRTGAFRSASVGSGAFLLLQYVPLQPVTLAHQRKLGRRLAQFHMATARAHQPFGFEMDNFLGLNQMRRMRPDCYEVWLLVKKVVELMPQVFEELSEQQLSTSSLLHGDIGAEQNWGIDSDGNLWMFDCVPFYGHVEMELVRVRNCPEILEEYHHIAPQQPGHEKRLELYELYQQLGLMNLRPTSRYKKNSMYHVVRLLEMIQPGKIDKTWPCGAELPTNKLRPPPSPHDPNANVLLIFLGTFSPVHHNHLSVLAAAAQAVQHRMHRHLVGAYFLPAGGNYVQKKLGPKGFSREHRSAMLCLALENTPWALATLPPVGKMGVHQIILDQLQQQRGWRMLAMYVCGIDAASTSMKRLPADVWLAVVRRNNLDREFKSLEASLNDRRERVLLVPEWSGPDISSSRVRNCMLADDEAGLRAMLSPNVVQYLRQHRLADLLRNNK